MSLHLMRPLLRTWPVTQARALPGNPSDALIHKQALNPLSHTSQGTMGTLVLL